MQINEVLTTFRIIYSRYYNKHTPAQIDRQPKYNACHCMRLIGLHEQVVYTKLRVVIISMMVNIAALTSTNATTTGISLVIVLSLTEPCQALRDYHSPLNSKDR